MSREKLNLTKKQARRIVWGSDRKFTKIKDEIIDVRGWSVVRKIVVQRKLDGKYFCDEYCEGATETQDEFPYDYSEPDFTEVFPVTKTITTYE